MEEENWRMALSWPCGDSPGVGGVGLVVEPPGVVVIQAKKRVKWCDFHSVVFHMHTRTHAHARTHTCTHTHKSTDPWCRKWEGESKPLCCLSLRTARSIKSLICDHLAQFIAQWWRDNCSLLGAEETQSPKRSTSRVLQLHTASKEHVDTS